MAEAGACCRFKTFQEESLPVVERYEAEGKAKRISAVPAPEVVFEEVVKVVDPLFGAPSTQVGCTRQLSDVVKAPRMHYNAFPLDSMATARPAHMWAALHCAVPLAVMADGLHVAGYGSRQPAAPRQ